MKYVKLSVVSFIFYSLFLVKAMAVNVGDNVEILKYKNYSLTLKNLTGLIVSQVNEPKGKLFKDFLDEYEKEYINKLIETIKIKDDEKRKESLIRLKAEILNHNIFKDIGKDYWTDKKTLKNISNLLRARVDGLGSENYFIDLEVLSKFFQLYGFYLIMVMIDSVPVNSYSTTSFFNGYFPTTRTGWAVFCIFWACLFRPRHHSEQNGTKI